MPVFVMNVHFGIYVFGHRDACRFCPEMLLFMLFFTGSKPKKWKWRGREYTAERTKKRINESTQLKWRVNIVVGRCVGFQPISQHQSGSVITQQYSFLVEIFCQCCKTITAVSSIQSKSDKAGTAHSSSESQSGVWLVFFAFQSQSKSLSWNSSTHELLILSS